MIAKTLSRGMIVAAAFVAMNSMAASHATGEMMKPAEMMKAPMMDTNKDGMVSKAEFLEMAGKMYEMKAKEMKAKDGMMTHAQFQDFWVSMSGGK